MVRLVVILPYSNPKEQIEGCIKCNRVNGMIVTSQVYHQILHTLQPVELVYNR
jgi:hypothetical protein